MTIQNWIPKSPINLFVLGIACGVILFWTFGCGGSDHGDHADVSGSMRTAESEGHDHDSDRAAVNDANLEDMPLLTAEELRELTPHYLRVSGALANDDYQTARLVFHEYMESVETPSGKVGEVLEALHTAPNIERAREAFHPVSRILIASVEAYGAPQETLYEAYCPIAFDNQGASWLQTDEAILNPYFGAMMLRCGDIEREFAAHDAPENDDGHAHH